MKIRGKFFVMAGVPVAVIVILALAGGVIQTLLARSVSDVAQVKTDHTTVLEGDRDAYQALLAEAESLTAETVEEVRALQESIRENAQQTLDRVTGPGVRFTEDMQADLQVFQETFAIWNADLERVSALAVQTAEARGSRREAAAAAIAAFDAMRDELDLLAVEIEGLLATDTALERRLALEQALSLALNADRDAYQVYVAQLLAESATTVAEIEVLSESGNENLQQTVDRTTQAAGIAGGPTIAIRDRFLSAFEVWRTATQRFFQISLANADSIVALQAKANDTRIDFDTMRDAIDRIGEALLAQSDAQITQATTMARISLFLFVIASAVGIVSAILIAAMTASRVRSGVLVNVQAADRISDGDLSVSLSAHEKDEIGQLGTAMRSMVESLTQKADLLDEIASGDLRTVPDDAEEHDRLGVSLAQMSTSLRELVGEIKHVVVDVTAGSDEVSQMSQSVSAGATQQAASLQEIGASLESVSRQARDNARAAKDVNSLAGETGQLAVEGNARVDDLNRAMTQIAESSDEITSIVKVIDDIAFQINLLALNANVEAARAGKYGKGFAVVAEEVRTLASRSASEVRKTTETVEANRSTIENGVTAAQKTTEQLHAIQSGVDRMGTMLNEIASASDEQAASILQINEGLDQVDQVTQAAAANAEESAAASQQLSAQAARLAKLAGHFRTGDETEALERTRSAEDLYLVAP